MRERFLEVLIEEGGFTLPEMLVTTVTTLVVLFALYNIFDMSIRVFAFGNDTQRPSKTPGWAWRRWSGS